MRGYLELRIEDPEHPGTILVAKGKPIDTREPILFVPLVRDVAEEMARQALAVVRERRKQA